MDSAAVAPKPEFQRVLWFRLRYPFAVVGIALATVGVGGDLIWHTILGAETGVARVIAPFHLLLFAGGGMLIAAPLRSAWHAPRHYPSVLSLHDVLPLAITDVVRVLSTWRARIDPAGGIWLLTPKRGQPGYVDQRELILAGPSAGLVDNKICSVDDTTSAMRFVIRRADRT